MSQAMVTNILCVVGWVGIAVLNHFGYVDGTTSSLLYGAIGVMGGYKNGSFSNNSSSPTQGTLPISKSVSQAVVPSERG